MCNSKKASSSAKSKSSALCDSATSPCVKPTEYELLISSPAIGYVENKSIQGIAVAVNNNWEGENKFSTAISPDKRKFEPIFDLDFDGIIGTERDLVPLSIKLSPLGAGKIVITLVGAADLLRIWPTAVRGNLTDAVVLPAEIPTANLPVDFWLEGLKTGVATLKVEYTSPEGLVFSDNVKISVVDLIEKQGGVQKIIYEYDSIIDFEVVGGPANFEYEWDLDGDGAFNSKPYETAGKNIPKVSCKFGSVESANTVKLDQSAANNRKIYKVAVRLTGGLILVCKGTSRVGGVKQEGIRVGLKSSQGSPLPPQSTAGLHTVAAWSNTVPVVFNTTDAAHRGANRISYKSPMPTANAITPYGPGLGAAREVYYVEVGPGIWTSGQTKEDLISTINHEIKHLRQHVAVRDDLPAGNVWRLLDTHFGSPTAYSDFRECEGHFSEVIDSTIGWMHIMSIGQGDLSLFVTRYNNCLALIAVMPAGAAQVAATQLLQGFYNDIPFDEMKRSGYEFYVRAPL